MKRLRHDSTSAQQLRYIATTNFIQRALPVSLRGTELHDTLIGKGSPTAHAARVPAPQPYIIIIGDKRDVNKLDIVLAQESLQLYN